MKKICAGAALVFTIACSSAIAEDQQVEPTQAEIDYMNKLDTHMGNNFGGNDKVDASVTQSDSGERRIHMDYSESQGAVITADPSQSSDGN
jgi:hypothetical protein